MKKIIYLFFTVTFVLFCSSAFTQQVVFMQAYDENGVKIDGGSTASGHVKDIEMLSYSFGVSGCVSCTPSVSDFSSFMSLDPASVTFKMMLLKGLHLTKVNMSYRKAGAIYDYYNVHMEDVVITSVQESGSNETPAVAFSLAPGKIAWQYTSDNGGVAGKKTKGGWDVGTNTEWSFY